MVAENFEYPHKELGLWPRLFLEEISKDKIRAFDFPYLEVPQVLNVIRQKNYHVSSYMAGLTNTVTLFLTFNVQSYDMG